MHEFDGISDANDMRCVFGARDDLSIDLDGDRAFGEVQMVEHRSNREAIGESLLFAVDCHIHQVDAYTGASPVATSGSTLSTLETNSCFCAAARRVNACANETAA